MSSNLGKFISLLLIFSSLLSACGPSVTKVPTELTTITPSPTSNPTATLTSAPTVTPTATPAPPPTPAAITHGLSLIDNHWNVEWNSGGDTVKFIDGAEPLLQWDFSMHNPLTPEKYAITHDLPPDMRPYTTILFRFYSPLYAETNIFLRILDRAGNQINIQAEDRPGWNDVIIPNFHNFENPNTPLNFSALDKIVIFIADWPDFSILADSMVQFSELRFLKADDLIPEANALAQRRAWDIWQASDVNTIGHMDSLTGWTGPSVDHLRLSDEGIGGSVQLFLDLQPHEHLRLEHNFLTTGKLPVRYARNSESYVGEMLTTNLAAYRSITFLYKSDVIPALELRFRLWDRQGGFVEWIVPSQPVQDWTKVQLSLPEDASSQINLGSVGGLIFEFQPGDSPIQGNLWLDELVFANNAVNGLDPESPAHFSPQVGGQYIPFPVENPIPASKMHLILSLSDVDATIAYGDVAGAIKLIQNANQKYKDVKGIEYNFGGGWGGDVNTLQNPDYFTDALVEFARWCEENKTPFWIQPINGDRQQVVTNNAIAAVIEAAPNSFLGVDIAEYASQDIDAAMMAQLETLFELMRQHEKHAYYYLWNDLWWQYQWEPQKMERVFAPQFADVLVPMWEILEPACANLALNSVLGFWVTDRVKNIGVSAQSWGWDNMRWSDTTGMPANVWMRMMVMSAAVGANYISIEPDWAMTAENLDALRQFSELVDSGVILPAPGWRQMQVFSGVAFQTRTPSNSWGWTPGVFQCADYKSYDRSEETMPGNVASYLYGTSHYYEDILPDDPFGLVPIIPKGTIPIEMNSVFQTDGRAVWKDGGAISAPEAKRFILASVEQGAQHLPFHAPGVLMSAYQISEGNYLLYLIDPEERFPVGVQTILTISLTGALKVYDALNGEELTSMQITVPAGGFRILRVVVQ